MYPLFLYLIVFIFVIVPSIVSIKLEESEKIKEMEEDRDSLLNHENELALNLYKYTMTGGWKEIVEMYKEHTHSAITTRINTSGDTVLHVAVFIALEVVVQQLVQIIIELSLESCLWITNNDGNTPLQFACSSINREIEHMHPHCPS